MSMVRKDDVLSVNAEVVTVQSTRNDTGYLRIVRILCIVLLLLAIVSGTLIADLLGPVTNELVARLDITLTEFGTISTFSIVPGVVLLFASGPIIDRFGLKPMLLMCSILSAVGTVVSAVAVQYSSYVFTLVGRLIYGGGFAPFAVCASYFSRTWFPTAYAELGFGLQFSAMKLGAFIAAMSAQPLLISTGSVVYVMYLGTAAGVVSLLATVVLVILARHYESKQPVVIKDAGANNKFNLKQAARVLPRVVIPMLWCSCFWASSLAIVSINPSMLQALFHFSPTEASWVNAASTVVAIIMTPLAGTVMKRLPYRSFFIIGGTTLICLSCGLLLAGVSPWIASAVLGLGMSLSPSAFWPSLSLLYPPEYSGTIFSLVSAAQTLGIFGFIQLAFSLPDLVGSFYWSVVAACACAALGSVFGIIWTLWDRFHYRVMNLPHDKAEEIMSRAFEEYRRLDLESASEKVGLIQ